MCLTALKPINPDLRAIIALRDSATGKDFGIRLATLLQCLSIAERLHFVPPFEQAWEEVTIHPVIRELSILSGQ